MRQQLWRGFAYSLTVSAAAGIGTFYLLHKIDDAPWIVSFVIALVPAMWARHFTYSNSYNRYRTAFKSRIVSALVKLCKPKGSRKVHYNLRESVSVEEFDESRLFRAPDIFTGEDLITATIGTTRIRFSQIEAKAITPSATGRTFTLVHGTIFKGLFFVADFNKTFEGTTIIGTDTSEELLGRFGRVLQRIEKQLTPQPSNQVHVEDPEFERLFNVYSTDHVEARHILSPAFIQRLSTLRARHGSDIYVSFSARQMFLAMPLRHGWLEPPSSYQPLNIEILEPCFEQLKLAFGIVEELNLNEQIWSG